jgi:hypothetical protein
MKPFSKKRFFRPGWGLLNLSLEFFAGFAITTGGTSLMAESNPPTTALTFGVVEDSFVKAGSSSTHGSAKKLEVDMNPQTESYLKFKVSGLTAGVSTAKIRVYVINPSKNAPKVKQVSNSWSASSMTYSTRPAVKGSTLSDKGTVTEDQFIEYDVTSAVSGNGTFSFGFFPDTTDGMDFNSKEAGISVRPQLVLTLQGTPSPPPIVDTEAPTVSLLTPKNGEGVSGTIILTASASDNVGVASVDFRWDSVSFGTPDTSSPYSRSWDTTKFANGFYTLTALARDAAGNLKISNLATIEVKNIASTPTPTSTPTPPPVSGLKRVPQDYSTIQAAINAASDGDTILIGPGTYTGGLKVAGKSLNLKSTYDLPGSSANRALTIIQSGIPILAIESSAMDSTVRGLTFKGGTKGIVCFSDCTVEDNIFDHVGSDAMSFESCGGIIRNNTMDTPTDDGIDIDGPGEVLVEGNTIKNAKDDCIELRNFKYTGPMRKVIFRNNTLQQCAEDGLQFIDYPEISNIEFEVERNLFINNAMAGLGTMDSGETVEDYRAGAMQEKVVLFNNTFVGNNYGITGGNNIFIVNNIITKSTTMGLKGADQNSIAAYNYFWNNPFYL